MLGKLLCRIGIHKIIKVYKSKLTREDQCERHCARCKRILTKRLR